MLENYIYEHLHIFSGKLPALRSAIKCSWPIRQAFALPFFSVHTRTSLVPLHKYFSLHKSLTKIFFDCLTFHILFLLQKPPETVDKIHKSTFIVSFSLTNNNRTKLQLSFFSLSATQENCCYENGAVNTRTSQIKLCNST